MLVYATCMQQNTFSPDRTQSQPATDIDILQIHVQVYVEANTKGADQTGGRAGS